MNEHLSQDQLIGYLYHTLADAQRETMDVHLGACRECRARLSGHEALGRRVQYGVIDWRRSVSPSPHMTFAAVAPKLRRSRKVARVWAGSKQVVYGAATLAVLVLLVVGLVLYFQNIGQPDGGLVSAEAEHKGGPQRTGAYDVKGPKRGELLWRFTTRSLIWSSPTVADEVAYVGSDDRFLYAVDTQTGQEKWRFDAGRPVRSTPAVGAGTVYFGSGCVGGGAQECGDSPGTDYYFYALDLQTGREKWRFEASGAIVSAPLMADGVVYFGSEDQHLYALDARTGREKWRFKAEDALWSSPALADGVVYIGDGCLYCGSTGNKHLYALDSQTGQELWRFEAGGWLEATPAVADGVVYIASGDRYVYALESQTGQEKWRFQTESRLFDSLAVGDGVLFAAGGSGNLYAIDGQSGQEVWRFETGGSMFYGPAIADGVVYVGNNMPGYLYAVEAQTGEELWSFQLGRSVTGSPVVGDGVVYFGSVDGNLYAVGDPAAVSSDDLGETSPSPAAMYGGGPQRTGVYDVKGPKRGELWWRFTTKGVVGTAPTVVDGVAYVGSQDGFLYAVDTQTAQEKWKFDTGRAVLSTPAVGAGTVYFGSGCIGGGAQGCSDPPGSDYYFYALDLETGREKWRFKTGDVIWSSPALADGLLYFGAGCLFCGSLDDTHLYAVDSQTGQEIWRFETGGWVQSTPAVADGTVYFGSGDRHVYAVDSQTGQERWRFETQGELEASLAVDAGLVFAASKDQHLYALDSQSGQEVWKLETGGLVYGAPAVADGVVYFAGTDFYAYAVEGQTGRELWRLEIFATCQGSPVVEDGVVYFGAGNYLSAVGEPQP